jgi:hypothetical protein
MGMAVQDISILNCGRAAPFSTPLIFSLTQHSLATYSISLQPPSYEEGNVRRRRYKRKFGEEHIAVARKYCKYASNPLISGNALSISCPEGPVTINDLLNELLIRIVSYILPSDESYKPKKILNLSLTSWRFHRITAPFLYNRYRYLSGKSSKLFLRTVVRHPNLAFQAKKIWVARQQKSHWKLHYEHQTNVSDGERQELMARIRRLRSPDEGESIQRLAESTDEVELTLLVSQTPNITDFCVDHVCSRRL